MNELDVTPTGGLRWGLRAPRPAPGALLLDLNRANRLVGIIQQRPPATLGLRIVCGLLAQESPGNPRGESSLSPGDFPWLSPDALHPGWRLSAAGPEAQRRQDGLPRSLPLMREPTWILNTSYIRYRSPEAEGLWCRCTRAAEALTSCWDSGKMIADWFAI